MDAGQITASLKPAGYPMRVIKIVHLLAGLALTGCMGVNDNAAPRRYLLETPALAAPRAAHPTAPLLALSQPQAAPGFDSVGMIYLRQPARVEAYAQSAWVDTPARMLLPLLARELENSGHFSGVIVTPGAPVSGEWRLDTEILRLQQEFFSEPAQVRLVVRAQLFDLSQRRLLASQVFEILEPAASADAAGGAAAANRAVERLLRQVLEFIARQERGKPAYSWYLNELNPSRSHKASRCAWRRSSATISATKSWNEVRACQPSFSRALLASPSRLSTSAGRK
jgi:cholesterol transport system auxiliary component